MTDVERPTPQAGETDSRETSIRKYADEADQQGGFVYCFRGEASTKNEGEYVNKQLEGLWYTESISLANNVGAERQNSGDERSHRVYAVVIPRTVLDQRDPHDKGNMHIVLSPALTSMRKELSPEKVVEFIEAQRTPLRETGGESIEVPLIPASKNVYLQQFGFV